MRIAVVSDSTAYLPKELIEKYNIYTIPLSVGFGDEFLREDIDISPIEFFERLREIEGVPTTSQPPIGTFVELYEKLAEQYDAVISIHLSKQISGTYETSISAGKMVENIDVYSYDSAVTAMAQGFYAIEAAEMVEAGKSVEQIITRLDMIKETVQAFFVVDDLSYLQRGGRLSGAQALVGSLLRIKPVIHMKDGYILPYERVRTSKRAIQRIVNLLEKAVEEQGVTRVVFTHTNNPERARKLKADFEQKYPDVKTVFSDLGPVVGTHLGEGAVGIGWYSR